MSDRRHKWSNNPTLGRECGGTGGRMKDEGSGYFPWMRRCFLFPSVLWRYLLGDRKGIWPTRNLPLINRGSRLEKTKEENMGDWLLQVHLENGCWNGDGGWWLMWIGILISNPQFFHGWLLKFARWRIGEGLNHSGLNSVPYCVLSKYNRCDIIFILS